MQNRTPDEDHREALSFMFFFEAPSLSVFSFFDDIPVGSVWLIIQVCPITPDFWLA